MEFQYAYFLLEIFVYITLERNISSLYGTRISSEEIRLVITTEKGL